MKNETTSNPFRILCVITFLITQCSMATAQNHLAPLSKLSNPIYFGYELAFAAKGYKLSSNIRQIDQMSVNQQGATLGVKLGNSIGAIRAQGGMYYSDGSVPYTVNMHAVTLSGHLYMLRVIKPRYHTLEPYLVASVGFEKAKFLGNYLTHDGAGYSEERDLGKIGWVNTMAGLGVEYQLENENMQFAHLFAEVSLGKPLHYSSSNTDYAATVVQSPVVAFSAGISFGKIH